jgi:hypothetical protein
MQQEDLFSRVQCGMFREEYNATFRARVQKIVEEHINLLLHDAKAVASKTNAMHRLPEIFRAGLDHTNTMTDAEKEQTRNEVMRKDPGFANFYEHAFYSYCAETVPELKEPNSVLRAMPPSLPTALHEIFKAVDDDPAVRSGEFSHKMSYLEKSYFVESMIRVAFYELLYTHKALRNISMARSSKSQRSAFGITGDAMSYRSFDVGHALADVATATPIGAASAVTASTAMLAARIREAETGSVASDWASNRTPIDQVGDDEVTLVSIDPSAATSIAASEHTEVPDESVVEDKPEQPVIEDESLVAAPSEATIDILSNFGHNKPFGDLPEPTGPEAPDPPSQGRCCNDEECINGDICENHPPCHCGDAECNRGSVCLNLPPSTHSFTNELTVKIGDGVAETVITPGDSVSQVLQ